MSGKRSQPDLPNALGERLEGVDFVEKLDRNHFDRVGVVIVGKILPFVKVFHYVYERVCRIRSKYFYDGLP